MSSKHHAAWAQSGPHQAHWYHIWKLPSYYRLQDEACGWKVIALHLELIQAALNA